MGVGDLGSLTVLPKNVHTDHGAVGKKEHLRRIRNCGASGEPRLKMPLYLAEFAEDYALKGFEVLNIIHCKPHKALSMTPQFDELGAVDAVN